MSDIESLFLAAYPLWPKVLIQKFSPLLSFEIAKFNPSLNREIIQKYESLALPISQDILSNQENQINILIPENMAKTKAQYFDFGSVRVFSAIDQGGQLLDAPGTIDIYRKFSCKIIYDKRIFSSAFASLNVRYIKTGYTSIRFSMFEAPSELIDPIGVVTISGVLQEYNGAESVLAMVENGVSVSVDEKILREFVTCINAYKKYGGELAAANSLQAERNRQTMTDYKNSISEKLNSRKNELNDLRTQILFAAKNETASAKRDMQSLALSAQSLMVQLQDKLK